MLGSSWLLFSPSGSGAGGLVWTPYWMRLTALPAAPVRNSLPVSLALIHSLVFHVVAEALAVLATPVFGSMVGSVFSFQCFWVSSHLFCR